MIAFKDFVPQPLNYTGPTKGFFALPKVPEFETFEKAVASGNAWIAQEAIRVIHVETVVLPHAYIHDARDVSQTGQAVLQASSLAFGSSSYFDGVL